MKRTESIGIRVTDEVKAAAIDAALSDHRSVSSLVEKLLIEYLVSDGYLDLKQDGSRRKNLQSAVRTQGEARFLTSADCD